MILGIIPVDRSLDTSLLAMNTLLLFHGVFSKTEGW